VKNLSAGKAISSLKKLRGERVFSKCLKNLQDTLIRRKISLKKFLREVLSKQGVMFGFISKMNTKLDNFIEVIVD